MIAKRIKRAAVAARGRTPRLSRYRSNLIGLASASAKPMYPSGRTKYTAPRFTPAWSIVGRHGNMWQGSPLPLQTSPSSGAGSPYTCTCQSSAVSGAKLSVRSAEGSDAGTIHGRRSPPLSWPAWPSLKLLERGQAAPANRLQENKARPPSAPQSRRDETDVSRTTLSTTEREHPIGGHARGVPCPASTEELGASAWRPSRLYSGPCRTLPEPRWAGLSQRSRSFARAR